VEIVPESLTAKDVMDSKVSFVEVSQTVLDTIKLMVAAETWSVIVQSQGRPVGVVTDRDILRKCLAKGYAPEKMKIEDIMASPIISVGPDERLGKIMDIMVEKNIRRVYVVENEKIIGRITQTKMFDDSLNLLESLSSLRSQL
jgi:CBS domain-containing protein